MRSHFSAEAGDDMSYRSIQWVSHIDGYFLPLAAAR
jgi:hypothetical protein